MKICRQNQDLPLQVESPQSLETSPLRSGEVYFLSLALVVTWHWSRAQSVRAWDYIRIINTIADDYLVSSSRVQRYGSSSTPVAGCRGCFRGTSTREWEAHIHGAQDIFMKPIMCSSFNLGMRRPLCSRRVKRHHRDRDPGRS